MITVSDITVTCMQSGQISVHILLFSFVCANYLTYQRKCITVESSLDVFDEANQVFHCIHLALYWFSFQYPAKASWKFLYSFIFMTMDVYVQQAF